MHVHRLPRFAWLAAVASGVVAASLSLPSNLAAHESARHGWADGDSYILMLESGRSTMMHGSTDDLHRARKLRLDGQPLLYVRRDGREYVVRDAALLRQAEAIFKPQAELGKKQGELGSRQGALGAQQAELGAQQARLAAQQVGAQGRSEEMSRRQDELGRQQSALGERQAELGRQQAKLGAEQERLGREARAKFRALVDDAIRRGLAQAV